MKKLFFLAILCNFIQANSQIKLFNVTSGKSDVVKEATYADIDLQLSDNIARTKPETLKLDIPYNGTTISVDLHSVNLFHKGFHLDTDQGDNIPYTPGAHYRGKYASFNFFNGEMNGIVSIPNVGNIVIAPYNGKYIIYNDVNLSSLNNFTCTYEDDDHAPSPTTQSVQSVQSAKCVAMYFEIDNSLFQANGNNTTTTANWFTSVFNNVQTLFSNSGISVDLKSTFIWTTADPYTGTTSTAQLNNFHTYRPTFDGDIGQLVGVDSGSLGGVAATVFGMCSNSNYSYTDVNFTYSNVPTYSWTVQVITHEMGHLMGSQHTHACAWNGNNTPIDGCGQTIGYSEGSCATGPLPASGSIMSYCHMLGGVGINFANGFWTQPAARIISSMNSSTCLSPDCEATCINAVNSVVVTAQTTSSLTVSWTDNSDTTSWMVGIFTYAGVGTYVQVNTNSYTKTGLLPNKFYKVRIKPVCLSSQSIAFREFVVATPADWCAGGAVICDTGGTTSIYGANQNYIRTLLPSSGNKLKLTFTQMALENGIDLLRIYNGTDTTSLIGAYTGNTLPAAITSTAANGALTLRFTSNATGNLAGFAATVSCLPITTPNCSASTTWNGSSWSNGTPTDTKSAIMNGNYLSTGPSFKCCSLTINAGKTVTIGTGKYISAVNSVVINGTLNVQDKGQLIQVSNTAVNSGNGHFYRSTGSLNASTYVYWSSPTDNTTISNALTGWGYFRKFTPANHIDIQTTNAQGVVTANVPDGYDDNLDSWVLVPTTTTMIKGTGYISRIPVSGIQTEDFFGRPTNGIVQVPISNSGNILNRNYNLVGNPYPSSISANDLIFANPGTTGILYFWTHNTSTNALLPGPVPGNYASTGDFSVYSLTGGVASESGSAVPTGVVASHQGFFVDKVTATNFTFNNAMRHVDLGNNTFLRQVPYKRLWLSLNGKNGLYHQILIGYLPDTQTGYDWGYDAMNTTLRPQMTLYSLIDDEGYRIQSRGEYDSADVVPLGFITQEAGEFTIRIDDIQGAFDQVYIRDLYAGTVANLTQPFTFRSEAGEFKDRFEVIYQNDSGPIQEEQIPLYIYPNPTSDLVTVSGNFSKYELYDMYGKLLMTGSDKTISLQQFSNGIYLLKIDHGKTFKVIKS